MKIVLTLLLPVIFAGSIFSQTNDLLFVLPSCPASINQSNANQAFNLSFNQTFQELKIENLQTAISYQFYSVAVVNAFGCVVYSNKYSDNIVHISIKDFSAGVYAVRIKYGDRMYIYKTIIF